MVSKDFGALSASHIVRAEQLATRYSSAADVLRFFSALASFQSDIEPRARRFDALPLLLDELVDFVCRNGPSPLKEIALQIDRPMFERSIDYYWQRLDTSSPQSFFARVVLQPFAISGEYPPTVADSPNACPRCGQLPQVAELTPQGHGKSLALVCSLCLESWVFGRVRCASCFEEDGRKMEIFSAAGYEHIAVQTCGTCRRYLICIDRQTEPDAISFVDELAAIPLDIWAQEQGYTKLQRNIVGI